MTLNDAIAQNRESEILAAQQKYQEYANGASDRVAELLRKQPPSLGLLNLLQNSGVLDKDRYFSVYTEVADKFNKEWPDN